MSKNNSIPLHKRAHFRRTREVITQIAKHENVNINDYDLLTIKAYSTVGENLKGKNVTYNTANGDSIWVLDNRYDIFEVPSINNFKGSPYGEFLYFAFNDSFDYYLFGRMTVTLQKEETMRTRFITEKIYFDPKGKFDIIFEGNKNNVTKVEYGYNFTPGAHSSEHNFTFDSYNVRKKSYGLSRYDILNLLGIKTTKVNKLVGSNKTPIYKDKKENTKKNNLPKKLTNKKISK
jgi:hypothetical protein